MTDFRVGSNKPIAVATGINSSKNLDSKVGTHHNRMVTTSEQGNFLPTGYSITAEQKGMSDFAIQKR